MTVFLNKHQAVRIIQSVSGECLELLDAIEKCKGWLLFPTPDLTDVIRNLRIQNYPILYENERLLQGVLLDVFTTPEEIERLASDYEQANESVRTELMDAFFSATNEAMSSIQWPPTIEERRSAEATFMALSPAERADAVKTAQRFMAGTMAAFYQMLSVMVHGERLTSLVAKAKAGDRNAFMKAVQIDTRVIEEIPYFRAEHERARREGDIGFMRSLAAARSRPPYWGRIRHKAVYWGFSVLQDLQMLDHLKHREILEIFDESGMNLADNRIEDVNYLTKRLMAFRQFQKTGVVSMQ